MKSKIIPTIIAIIVLIPAVAGLLSIIDYLSPFFTTCATELWISSPQEAEILDTVPVKGKLVRRFNVPVPSQEVEIYINGQEPVATVVTDENGDFYLEHDFKQTGDYTLAASFLGTEVYQESKSETSIGISKAITDTILNIPRDAEVNEVIHISGKLKRKLYAPVADQELKIYVDNEDIVGSVITDENGTFSLTHAFEEVGDYTLTADFEGTEQYEHSNTEANIRIVMPTDIVLEIPPTARVGEEVPIRGQLIDLLGNFLDGQKIEVFCPGTDLNASLITNKEGRYYLEYAFEKAGKYRWSNDNAVEARFLSTGYYLEVSEDRDIDILEKGQIPTKTRILSVGNFSPKENTFRVKGMALAEDGSIAEDNLPVEIFLSGGAVDLLVGKGETSQGYFDISCNVPKGTNAQDYQVKAHSLGNPNYLDSWNQASIKPATPTIATISVARRIPVYQVMDISGELTEESGSPLINQEVAIYKGEELIKKVRTNKDGAFSTEYTINEPGDYLFTAKFEGTEKHQATSETVYVRALMPTTISVDRPENIKANQAVKIAGSLMDKSGKPLANKEVEAYLDGTELVACVTTDENGTFFIEHTIDEIGNYVIEIRSVESDYYLGNYILVPFEVGGNMPAIAIVLPEFIRTDEVTFITGSLIDEFGVPIPSGEVAIYLNEELIVKELTDEAGAFAFEHTFKETDDYVLTAKFAGTGAYMEASSTSTLRVNKEVTPAMNIYTSAAAIRNEQLIIGGRLSVGKDPATNEHISVTLDDTLIAQLNTDNEGLFEYTLPVEPDESLGSHVLNYELPRFARSYTQEIVVRARTSLELPVPETVRPGEIFRIEATLKDDLAAPIAEASISLPSYKLRSTTGNDGIALFDIPVPDDFTAPSLELRFEFEGTNVYLPCEFTLPVPVTARVLFPWWSLLLLIPVIVGGVFKGYPRLKKVLSRGKKEPVEDTSSIREAREQSVEQPILTIAFPQIEKPFPDVWGPGEEIEISCHLTDGSGQVMSEKAVDIYTDDSHVGKITINNGRGSINLVFETKGEFAIIGKFEGDAIYLPATAKRVLRIVDYREEVITLFNSLLGWLRNHEVRISEEATPREIEQALLQAYTAIDKERLNTVIGCFEEANYSRHQIQRQHYEKMFLAQESVKDSCGE